MPEISDLFHMLIIGVLVLCCEEISPPGGEIPVKKGQQAPETFPGQGNVAV